jgi:hypothetical protein
MSRAAGGKLCKATIGRKYPTSPVLLICVGHLEKSVRGNKLHNVTPVALSGFEIYHDCDLVLSENTWLACSHHTDKFVWRQVR